MLDIPEKLREQHSKLEDKIDMWLAKYVQEGTIIRWISGEYKGRRARVKHVYWDTRHDGYQVRMSVETERHDKKGWMDSDRYIRKFNGNFELIGG